MKDKLAATVLDHEGKFMGSQAKVECRADRANPPAGKHRIKEVAAVHRQQAHAIALRNSKAQHVSGKTGHTRMHLGVAMAAA